MAQSFGEQLQSEIDLWNLEHPAVAEGRLVDERRRVVIELREIPRPPLVQWSALVGNVLAGLRTSLDSFAWQIAHLNGSSPKNPRRVYFPIFGPDAEKKWRQWLNNMGQLPDPLAERIRSLQAFSGSPLGRDLQLLAALNNQDKHREALSLGLDASSATLDCISIDLGGPRETVEEMTLRQLLDEVELREGVPIFEVSWDGEFKSVTGVAEVGVAPRIDVSSDEETINHEPAVPTLKRLHGAVNHVLDSVCRGDDQGLQNIRFEGEQRAHDG